MHKLYVGNKNYSSWSLRGWLVTMLSGASFTESPVELSSEGTLSPAFRAFSFRRSAPHVVARLSASPAHGRAPPSAPSRAA